MVRVNRGRWKRLGTVVATAIFAVAGLIAFTPPAYATTFTVTNTNDSGAGSLRAAITAANADGTATSGSPHVIQFSIPGEGLHTISILSSLPQMVRPVFVDGLSQPGSVCGTLTPSLPANSNTPHQLKVEITGRNALPANTTGSTLSFGAAAGGSRLRGVVVNGNNSASLGQVGLVATNMLIECNYIGTNAAGTASASGVSPLGMNLSGGGTEVRNNLVSGNRTSGIFRAGNTADVNDLKVHDNLVGTTADGFGSIPNGSAAGIVGINLTKGSNNQVYNNVISGNLYNNASGIGLTYVDQTNLKVFGNLIGVALDGVTALPNHTGIENGGTNGGVVIGGMAASERNVISRNYAEGIAYRGSTARASNATVIGNYIGVAADGTTAAGNGGQGISLQQTTGMKIGGTNVVTEKGNIIANNGGAGVRIFGSSSSGNTVRGNTVYANGGPGIDLGETAGPTENDANDADTGANALQNFPRQALLTGCSGAETSLSNLRSAASTTYSVDFYSNTSGYDPSGYGEGQTYLSSSSVTTDSQGYAAVTTPAGSNLSMTATSPGGNTSEFSNRRTLSASGCNVTVKTTNDQTPAMSGSLTISGFTPTVTLTVAGQTVGATRSGNSWAVADNSFATIADGTYDAVLTVTDAESGLNTSYTRSNALVVASSQPTASIVRKAGQAAYTNNNSADFTVTFNHAIIESSFTAGDLALGSTSGAVTGLTRNSDTEYEFQVTGMTDGDTVTASLPAGRVSDAANNANLTSTGSPNNTVVYDATQPASIAISADITSNGHGMNDPSVSFSAVDSGSGIDHYTVSVDGSGFTTQTSPYEPTLTPASGHTVVVRAYDRAGNMRERTYAYPPSIEIIAPTILSNASISDTTIRINGPGSISIDYVQISGAGASGFDCGALPRPLPFDCTGGTITASGQMVVTAESDATGQSTSNSQAYTIETIRPGVTVNQSVDQEDPTGTDTAEFTLVFSEQIDESSLAPVDLTLAGTAATVASLTKVDSRTWNALITGLADGDTVVASLQANRVTDLAGNGNFASTSTDNSVTYDVTPPTVTVNQAAGQADPTRVDSAQFTVVFSEPVTGLTADGFVINGTSGSVTDLEQVSATTWTATVSGMTSGSAITLSLPADAVRDAGGNTNNASTSTDNSVNFDNVVPVVTVNALTTATRSPALSGTVDDATATVVVRVNGTNYTATNNGSGSWSLTAGTITPQLSNGTYPVLVTATDAAGNAGTDATDNELVIDFTRPSVTVNQAAGQADPTNGSEVRFTIVFSKPMNASSFIIADLTLGGTSGVVSDLAQVNATTWTAIVIGMANGNNVTLSVADGRATDTLGNSSTASTSTDNSVTFDNAAPTITVTNLTTNQTSPALSGTVAGNPVAVTIRVNGTDYPGVINGSNWNLAAGVISPALADAAYNVQARATDAAGNVGNDATNNELTIITSPFTVTVNQAAGQADPTNADQAQFTVVFNRAINESSLVAADIALTGTTGTVSSLTKVNSTTWTATVTGMTDGDTVTASLPAGRVNDLAGNANAASGSTDNSATYDATAPTATIASKLTNRTSPSLSGTVGDPTATIRVTVDGIHYTATNNGNGTWSLAQGQISPALTDGVYAVVVRATDAAGNLSDSTNSSALTVDTAAPAVGTVDDLTTQSTSPGLTGTTSEAGATIRVTVDGNAYTASSTTGNNWSLAAGTITPALSAQSYAVSLTLTDAAGNVSATATGQLTVESAPVTPPTPAPTPPAPTPTPPTPTPPAPTPPTPPTPSPETVPDPTPVTPAPTPSSSEPANSSPQAKPQSVSPAAPTVATNTAAQGDEASPETIAVTERVEDVRRTPMVVLNDFNEYQQQGKPMQLSKDQVVYFRVAMPAGEQQHSATVSGVGSDYADVTLASTPRTYRLFVGDTKRYDVTDDGIVDIEVTLAGISAGVADLRFKQLFERASVVEVATPAQPQSDSDHNVTWLILVVCLSSGILLVVVHRQRRKKQR